MSERGPWWFQIVFWTVAILIALAITPWILRAFDAFAQFYGLYYEWVIHP